MDDASVENVQDDLRIIARSTGAKGLPNGLAFKGGCNGMALVLLHHLPSLKKLEIKGLVFLETLALSSSRLVGGSLPVGLFSLEDLTMIYDAHEPTLQSLPD